MRRPTLDDFLKLKRDFPRNGYVREAGFKSLYVRKSARWLEGKRREVLDLASLVAKKPGNGAFKALVARLRREYPRLHLYVENVLNPKFAPGLIRMGFKPDLDNQLCYYLLSNAEREKPTLHELLPPNKCGNNPFTDEHCLHMYRGDFVCCFCGGKSRMQHRPESHGRYFDEIDAWSHSNKG